MFVVSFRALAREWRRVMADRVITRSEAEKKIRRGEKLTRQEAGSLGGQTTLKKRGKNWLRLLARRGARAMHEIYKWEPVGTSDFALTYRATGEPTGKTINGKVLPAKRREP